MRGTSPIDGRTAAALLIASVLLVAWGGYWGWQTASGWEELQERSEREVSYEYVHTYPEGAVAPPRATPSVVDLTD